MNKVGWSSILVATTLLAVAAIAEAQQPKNMPRIGYLGTVSLSINAARANAFRRGLHDLGYMEGKSIIIEWRSADGKLDRLATIATDLVRLKVDVLVTGGNGFVGRHVVAALLERGDAVRVLALP